MSVTWRWPVESRSRFHTGTAISIARAKFFLATATAARLMRNLPEPSSEAVRASLYCAVYGMLSPAGITSWLLSEERRSITTELERWAISRQASPANPMSSSRRLQSLELRRSLSLTLRRTALEHKLEIQSRSRHLPRHSGEARKGTVSAV